MHIFPVLVVQMCGVTPLMIAAEKGHTELVQELLEHGADLNASEEVCLNVIRNFGFLCPEYER